MQLDAYSLWTKFAAKLVCRKLGFPTDGISIIIDNNFEL